MIVAQQKPLEETRRMIAPYQRVLIVGCGTCMTVCDAGGEREVSYLRNALQVAQARSGNEAHTFAEYTVKNPAPRAQGVKLKPQITVVVLYLSPFPDSLCNSQ